MSVIICDMNVLNNQVLRYIVGGGTSFLVEFSIFNALFYVNIVGAGVASGLSFCVGLVSSLIINKLWVFEDRQSRWSLKQTAMFIGLGVFNLVFTSFAVEMMVAVGILGFLAKIIMMVSVAVWNYVIMKSVIFKKRD